MPSAVASSDRCPLCGHGPCQKLDCNVQRVFKRCPECQLTFVPERFHLSLEEEKAIYDYHENNPDDPGYQTFLSRLTTPLSDYLKPGACGLDFGCGPGPAIAPIMSEKGFSMCNYDPFYAPDVRLLNKCYDFVTCTEVVEHLRHPATTWKRLFELLSPQGTLGVMTKSIPPSLERFSHWHYTRDLSHIAFYHTETLRFIANQYDRILVMPRSDVMIFLPQETASQSSE